MPLIDVAKRLWERLELRELTNINNKGNEFRIVAKSDVGKSGRISFHEARDLSSALVYGELPDVWIDIREVGTDTILEHTTSQNQRNYSTERLLASGFIGAMLHGNRVRVIDSKTQLLYQLPIPGAEAAEDFFYNFITYVPPPGIVSTENRTENSYKPSKRQQGK